LYAGDQITLRTNIGIREFVIAAVVVDFFNQGEVIQGTWSDMSRYFQTNDASIILIKVASGYNISSVQAQIEATYAKRNNLFVISNQQLIKRGLQLLDQVFSLFNVLSLIAMLVAGLGVINTLTMNVLERTQEIGMLRSIGLTRKQVLTMILAEAGVMGLIGGLLGLAFGTILTRIFLLGMTAMSGYKISLKISAQVLVIGLLISAIISQLAAILPARRAARTPILDAIHYE
jgi:putative ABC transport system permease protein